MKPTRRIRTNLVIRAAFAFIFIFLFVSVINLQVEMNDLRKERDARVEQVQLIQDEKTKTNYYIEINPRFGGGAPLSMKAGADAAEALIRILRGETLAFEKGAAEDGAIYSRFDQSVRVN